mgnify:CR=1 FL=1
MPAKAAPKGRVILTYGRSLMALVIARSLAQRGVEVIGCDDVDLTVLSFSKHVKETFAVAPWRSEPERFLDDLEAAVMEHAPHDGRPYVLMPVFSEGELIAKYRERFEPTCKVAMPLWSSFDQVQPKDHLAALAERAGVPAPKTWAVPNEEVLKTLAPTLPYPIIVKPSAAGTLTNHASVSSPVSDPNSANNSVALNTTVNAALTCRMEWAILMPSTSL